MNKMLLYNSIDCEQRNNIVRKNSSIRINKIEQIRIYNTIIKFEENFEFNPNIPIYIIGTESDKTYSSDIRIKDKLIFIINKTIDEWFYLAWSYKSDQNKKFREEYYKCDQIDGLVECIDKLLKNDF